MSEINLHNLGIIVRESLRRPSQSDSARAARLEASRRLQAEENERALAAMLRDAQRMTTTGTFTVVTPTNYTDITARPGSVIGPITFNSARNIGFRPPLDDLDRARQISDLQERMDELRSIDADLQYETFMNGNRQIGKTEEKQEIPKIERRIVIEES